MHNPCIIYVIIEKSVSVEEELEGVAVIYWDGITSTETPIENIDEEPKKEDVRHWDNEDLWEATQLEDVIESNDDDDDENINEKYEQENKKEDDTNEFPI